MQVSSQTRARIDGCARCYYIVQLKKRRASELAIHQDSGSTFRRLTVAPQNQRNSLVTRARHSTV